MNLQGRGFGFDDSYSYETVAKYLVGCGSGNGSSTGFDGVIFHSMPWELYEGAGMPILFGFKEHVTNLVSPHYLIPK